MNNIQGRLKKIESQLGNIDRVHCSCPGEILTHVIIPSEDVEDDRGFCLTCKGVCLSNDDIPCAKCGKLFVIDSITVTYYDDKN